MKFFKVKFDQDVNGFYLTPLIGYSKVMGKKAIWFGWFFWLFTIEFTGRDS